MTTPVTQRESPDGFTIDYDATMWNVGFVFRWSEFYECYLDESVRLSIKPGDNLAEVYERECGEGGFGVVYEVFFVHE